MANKLKERVSPHNAKVYMDVATDIFDKKQGMFTFVVRIDGKKIVDYVLMESISYND